MDNVVERVKLAGKRKTAPAPSPAVSDDISSSEDEERPAPAPKPKRRAPDHAPAVMLKHAAREVLDPDDAASPLRVTDKAWVWVRPRLAARDRVPAKVEHRAGKWTLYSEDGAVHTARWKAIREAVAQGNAGYLAGATTAHKSEAYASAAARHVISVHVGDGDNVDAQRAVLGALRAAGVSETLYFKAEGAATARYYSRAGSTDVALRDGHAPAPALVLAPVPAPSPAPMHAKLTTTATAMTKLATTTTTAATKPVPLANGGAGKAASDGDFDWDDPALLATLDAPGSAATHAAKLDAVTLVVAVDKDWVFSYAVSDAVKAAAAEVGVTAPAAVTLVYGDGKGAERAVMDEARGAGYRVVAAPAKWTTEGSGAGKKRNADVMATHKPAALLVFPSPDTANRANTNTWAAAARAAGVPIKTTYHDVLVGSSGRSAAGGGFAASAATALPPHNRDRLIVGVGDDDMDALLACITADMVDAVDAVGTVGTASVVRAGVLAADDEMAALLDVALTSAQAQVQVQAAPLASAKAYKKGLLDPDTVCVPNPAHHALIVRPPLSGGDTYKAKDKDTAKDKDEDTLALALALETDDHDAPAPEAVAELKEDAAGTIARVSDAVVLDVMPSERAPFTAAELALLASDPKPRAEWLVYEEFYRRFVMLTQAQADAIISAPQGTDTPWSVTTADVRVPLPFARVRVEVAASSVFPVGQDVLVTGAGFYHIESVPSPTAIVLRNLGTAGNAKPGAAVAAGAKVSIATWILGRLFAITASQFGAAIGVSPYQAPHGKVGAGGAVTYGLLEEKLWDMFSGNEATRWGNAHEPDARDSFAAWFLDTWLAARYAAAGLPGARYHDAKAVSAVLEFGLIAFPQTPWMRVSPDGVALFKDVDGRFRVALVEFKCPFYLWDAPDHPYAKYPKNTPPQYNAQIQGIMGFLNMDTHAADWRRVLTAHLATAAPAVAAAVAAAPLDVRVTECFFVVWQPRQLWITRRDYDAAYFGGTVFPALKAWYFKEFLPAATHKYNGRLAFGGTAPARMLEGSVLTDEQLAVAARSAAMAAADKERAPPYPAWGADHVATRLAALADEYVDAGHDAAVLAAFSDAKDTKGRSKLEGLRRSVADALADADDAQLDVIVSAATTLLKDGGGTFIVQNLEWLASKARGSGKSVDDGDAADVDVDVVTGWMVADPVRAIDAIFGRRA